MSDSRVADLIAKLVPRYDESSRVIGPPTDEPGAWAGSPSAIIVDGVTWIAYRPRRPGLARGYANVLARSDDGETFETVFARSSSLLRGRVWIRLPRPAVGAAQRLNFVPRFVPGFKKVVDR